MPTGLSVLAVSLLTELSITIEFPFFIWGIVDIAIGEYYSVLDIKRRSPIPAIIKPTITKMFEKWVMSPAGGASDALVKVAPIITSNIPNIFSTSVNPMGISVLKPKTSRFNFTVSRLF